MAMLPFCGYNMSRYFEHWLETGERHDESKLPRIFYVNWFRKDESGRFLWPGFGENSRVLAWIFRRCDEDADAVDTPIGRVPAQDALDVSGLEVSPEDMAKLLAVEPDQWSAQLPQVHEHYARFGDNLPAELRRQLEALEERLR
jgi:phosphoenolpyruvate carboxykinase (GTP)